MERREGCSRITQQNSADGSHKCSIGHCLAEGYSVIAGIRSSKLREPAARLPVKFAALHDDTADGCSVAADKFCSGMYHNIRTILNRSYQIRCCKGIVDYKGDSMLVSDCCNLLNINHIGIGIAQRLNKYRFRIFFDALLYLFKVGASNGTGSQQKFLPQNSGPFRFHMFIHR